MSRPKGSTQRHAARVARLSSEEFADQTKFTPEQVEVLDKIANGKPPRNSLAILRGMELKASYAYSKPKQGIEHSGAVTITVDSGIVAPPGGEGTA